MSADGDACREADRHRDLCSACGSHKLGSVTAKSEKLAWHTASRESSADPIWHNASEELGEDAAKHAGSRELPSHLFAARRGCVAGCTEASVRRLSRVTHGLSHLRVYGSCSSANCIGSCWSERAHAKVPDSVRICCSLCCCASGL